MIFETTHLIIREFRESDLSTIHSYARQEQVVQYQKWGPNTLGDSREFLEEVLADQQRRPRHTYEWCITLKPDQQHIGGCGLYLQEDSRRAMIGYILHPDYWNCGYMSEAVMGLIDYGQHILKIKHWEATCDRKNLASRRVLEKNGFQLIRTIEDDFEIHGRMRTTLLFSLV